MLHIVMVIRKKIQLWQANCSPDMEYTVSKGVMASVQAFYFCFPSMLCWALSTSSFSCIFWLSHVGYPSDREQERTRKMATCLSDGSNLLLSLSFYTFLMVFRGSMNSTIWANHHLFNSFCLFELSGQAWEQKNSVCWLAIELVMGWQQKCTAHLYFDSCKLLAFATYLLSC